MLDLFAPKRKTPRQHQIELLEGLKQAIREGHRRIVCQLPTGGGKTFTALLISRGALEKGNTVCFSVPAIELIDQTVEAFEEEGIERIGVLQGDHPRVDGSAPMQVASVQTLGRRSVPASRIVIVDECHVYSKVITDWMQREPDTLFVGLSATPWREGMKEEWGKLVAPVTMQDLIDRGLLSQFRVFAPSQPDLSKVKTVKGDFDTAGASDVMSDRKLVADVVSTWLTMGRGRPTLCFAVDRSHAAKLQQEFERAGVRTGYVDAFTPKPERKLIKDRFARGDLEVVCNVGVLTTGVDWDVRCIIMARPTKSEMLFVQMFGRGTRPAEGKEDLLFLDHTSNTLRLGFPTDIHHPDLLPKGAAKREAAERKDPLPKACPSCQFVKPPKTPICPACGFKPEGRSQIEAEEGELEELRGKKKPKPPTQAERQLFYSMALHYAWDKGKGGSMALALYKEKFGSFPRGLREEPVRPNREWLNWRIASTIRFRKRQEAQKRRTSQGAVA